MGGYSGQDSTWFDTILGIGSERARVVCDHSKHVLCQRPPAHRWRLSYQVLIKCRLLYCCLVWLWKYQECQHG